MLKAPVWSTGICHAWIYDRPRDSQKDGFKRVYAERCQYHCMYAYIHTYTKCVPLEPSANVAWGTRKPILHRAGILELRTVIRCTSAHISSILVYYIQVYSNCWGENVGTDHQHHNIMTSFGMQVNKCFYKTRAHTHAHTHANKLTHAISPQSLCHYRKRMNASWHYCSTSQPRVILSYSIRRLLWSYATCGFWMMSLLFLSVRRMTDRADARQSRCVIYARVLIRTCTFLHTHTHAYIWIYPSTQCTSHNEIYVCARVYINEDMYACPSDATRLPSPLCEIWSLNSLPSLLSYMYTCLYLHVHVLYTCTT